MRNQCVWLLWLKNVYLVKNVKVKCPREIANILSISEKTVRNHISNTMQKLSVKGRAQAVVELIRLGEITL
ncbi:MAG: LuxR C-terminal-related transcriptional regulator [Bacilli bacterium]